MALAFAHGVIQWIANDAVNTIYTVSGLAFQPAALRFCWVGIGSATDAVSTTTHSTRGVGVAVSTSSRRCVASFSATAVGNAACASGAFSDAVVVIIDDTGAVVGALDLNSITSDGFTLIVDNLFTPTVTVGWKAWGGSDITVAAVGDIAEPAATGDQDYTVTGFVSGATDQVVMLAGVQSVQAVGTGEANDNGMHVGFATSGTAADNITICGNSDDGSATMDTDGYCQDGECLSMILIAGGNPNARATLTQFGTDNFRLNWIARGTTNRRSIFLAIKGGNWKAGSYTIDASVLNGTTTVGGLPFSPIGLCLMGRHSIEQVAGNSVVDDMIGMGSASSPTSRHSMAVLDENGTASSEIDMMIEYDQLLAFPNASGTVQSAFDLDNLGSDSFRVIVDTAGGGINQWQGYLTFGNAAVSAVQAPLLSGSERYMRTGG
jgi:hypothetical protein